MRASYQWIRALAPGLEAGAQELAARFTSAGLEVEATTAFGAGAERCQLVWVVRSRPHPTKSGLRLVTVDRGGTLLEVVCGAPNVPEPGGVVVLAPLGAHLPAKGMTIERRDIGGVSSEGMLCSEAELGLTDEAEGILVFPPGFAEPGARFVDVVPEASDVVLEIGLTPNRPDGLGHIGLAREAAALFRLPWEMPEPEASLRRGDRRVDEELRVRIEDEERCPHYGAALVTDVAVGPSPHGVRYRLSALGVRPISNAVDVTNLVMLEYGHPMHAFDADNVRGQAIVVRRAHAGERLVTLDGVDRELVVDDLVIADAEGPIALAGVMGGLASEITSTTRRIALECAYFDPRGVRRTARRHNLHSESSHRFERGVDPGDTRGALAQATSLMTRLTGGSASSDVLVLQARELPAVRVHLEGRRLRDLVGEGAPADLREAGVTLERLGFSVSSTVEDTLDVVVPTHRPDVMRDVDVIDEVVRVRGMDVLAAVLPAIRATRAVGGREGFVRRARSAARSIGLSEALTFGFTSSKALAALGAPEPLRILNPLTDERDAMRTSLLPGLFDAVRRARRRGVRDVRLFTTGALFVHGEEEMWLAVVLAGDRPAYLVRPESYDAWDATGHATALVSRIVGERGVAVVPGSDRRYLHPRGAAQVLRDGTTVGVLGPLHPDTEEALDLGGPVLIVELSLDQLAAGASATSYVPVPRYPAATRDIALVVRDGVPAGEVLRALRDVAHGGGDVTVTVELFDRFLGTNVPSGHASLAFHVVYQAADRTLTDTEVDASHAKLVEEMHRRFGAQLR